ncbi:MAG TPA: hypothetical protein VMF60_05670 [Acidimicrobiales bacterium]|nr:hypothetical protein [Acidimicrobiales bacterium]
MRDDTRRRAARLARLYPRRWLRRYPDFVGVLAAELAEHPWRATGDVVRAAAGERLRTGHALATDPTDRARCGLGLVEAAVVPFAGLAIGLWSQLDTGLAGRGTQGPPALRGADLLLAVATTAAFACFATVTGLVLLPALRRRRQSGHTARRSSPWRRRPALVFAAAMTMLSVAGWAADRSGWYSPAAAALPGRGLGRLLTLWARGIVAVITPAWVHPSLFGQLPAGELVGTLLAPGAALAAALSLRHLVRGLPPAPPGRLQVLLCVGTAASMFLALAAAIRWLLTHPRAEGATPLPAGTDPLAPGHTAWAVVALLATLAVVALVGTRRLLAGRPPPWEESDDAPVPARR